MGIASCCIAQMPGWVLMRDKDSNKYYVDQRGKLWTMGKPDFTYKPVSFEGLEYYLHQGKDLLHGFYPVQGMTLLKSLCQLPSENKKIYDAQVIALKEIKRFEKKGWFRYSRVNEQASLLLYREGGVITIMNDRMGFRLRIPYAVEILNRRRRDRYNYIYDGFSAGILTGPSEKAGREKKKFDALLAVDSERFQSVIRDVDQLVVSWKNRLGEDVFERKKIMTGDYKQIYEISYAGKVAFSGFEGYYIRGRYGIMIRMVFDKEYFSQRKEEILKILEGLKYR